jgi:ubiquinone/menaquinone biosynthesis C-methylase UbiE
VTQENTLVEQVQTRYGAVARSELSGAHAGVRAVAEAFGYTPEELASLPADANMGLSCGNPVATARLRPGETVVDLGCGGGIDVLLAARQVGPSGKAIGIDMTPDMIERARRNASRPIDGQALTNVEFHLGRMEQLPLPDASVDCLISNCVINLAPDKSAVFREMFRVLKPGGRVAVSDIALKRPLPAEVAQDVMAYVGCVAGALLIPEYERLLREAGFAAVQVVDTRKDLNAYAMIDGGAGCCSVPQEKGEALPVVGSSCCGGAEPGVHEGLAGLLARYNVNDYAASVQVYALKAADSPSR